MPVQVEIAKEQAEASKSCEKKCFRHSVQLRLIYKVVLMIIGEGERGDVDTSSEESLRSTLSLIYLDSLNIIFVSILSRFGAEG
ncbi:hypothetical protein Nepgr_026929 [Nepenthes gracilis]|uniref:Uncharacterized protein n=1 Tax=Nepenthes gracilis TaxID=150966 RepID=A0AAD3TAN3_NEPGR|nr:hypothetical protein Nepgr_026929 [Nepenthes gracilis]